MDSNSPRSSESGLLASLAGECPGLTLLLSLSESVASVDAIERMLMAYAVHRDGLGFERAHLLLHDTVRDELWAWAGAAASRETQPIAEAVARAGLLPPSSPTSPLRQMRWSSQSLEGLAHLAWENEPVAFHADGDAGAEGAVLLRSAARRHGLIVGGWERAGEEPERARKLEHFHAVAHRVLTTFERRQELRCAEARAEALAELSRAAVSSLNVAEVLHLVAEIAVRSPEMAGAAVWTTHVPDTLRLKVTHGPDTLRERAGRALHPFAIEAWTKQKPMWVEDGSRDARLALDGHEPLSHAAVLPLVAYGRPVGALAVYGQDHGRPSAGPVFDAEPRRYLAALADHVALALDQAERCAQLQCAAERERQLRARLQRLERLAEFGMAVAERVRVLRNPVASLVAFARRAHGQASEQDANRDYLEIVMREAERLQGVMDGIDTQAEPHSPALERVQPNDLIQQSLQKLAERLVRRRIRLVKKLSPDVPVLVLDSGRVREAVWNLLEHAGEAVALGGRLKVESKKLGGHVMIEIAHDGARGAGDALEQLFVPFTTPGPGGHSSLAIASRIVREHGGEIRIRSEGEWSSIVAFTLPIRDNQDRRRVNGDRRRTTHDRRLRFPEALSG